ncbi:MAG TPA: class II aldolase/adducin family protein [Clostridiaceae bacterium]|nr:class II aldolase/adducin family protein [Clostridiaceae bacterium]
MTLREAKEAVVLAGRKLVETGLIARTWGNVSCRVSDTHFVITPSGRDYMSLTPDDIVEVSVSDLSYSGNIKPSSEKGIHALVYKTYPEAGFVIHTHQSYASAVSAMVLDSIDITGEFPLLGDRVICADYGLPGTKKLRRGVEKALARSSGKAVIMKNHGALCFGTDCDEAFRVAHELELSCKRFIEGQYKKLSGGSSTDPVKIGWFAISVLTGKNISLSDSTNMDPWESERTEKGFILKVKDRITEIDSANFSPNDHAGTKMADELMVLNEIYKNNKNINNVIHSDSVWVRVLSHAGIMLRPLLDDFAQIAGTSVKTTHMDPGEIIKALKSSSAVLLRYSGALCCGVSRDDAAAVSMVLEKNCMAYMASALSGRIEPISLLECKLMRFVYLNKYSKLK